MRILFKIDTKDYDPNGRVFIRPSVRGIIIRNGKAAMVHSLKYDYYKFPGGGIEPMESHIDALIREVREESGLQVIGIPFVNTAAFREYRNQIGQMNMIFSFRIIFTIPAKLKTPLPYRN